MAAVTRVKARPCTPVGYEVVEKSATLTEAVVAGDLLTLGASGWSKAATSTVNAHGIALQDGYAGQKDASVGIQGEMDGFSGMTPGAPLYPSGTTAGGIDTTAPTSYSAATTPAVAVPAAPDIRAVTASRIRYRFI